MCCLNPQDWVASGGPQLSDYRLPRCENTEDLVAPKGRSAHTPMHTPNREMIHLSTHRTFLEFLLSPCASLLVQAWTFLVSMSWLALCVSYCLNCVGTPFFPSRRADQVCCPFLGTHPTEGAGPASQVVQAVLACTQLQGLEACQAVHVSSLCMYYYCWRHGIHSKGAQWSPLMNCKAPFYLPST